MYTKYMAFTRLPSRHLMGVNLASTAVMLKLCQARKR